MRRCSRTQDADHAPFSPATIILLQTAPIGFAAVGWKYFLVVIIWSTVFIPILYFYWPETAKLSLEEIGKQFGDEVAVHINDATDAEKAELDAKLARGEGSIPSSDRKEAEPEPSTVSKSGDSK